MSATGIRQALRLYSNNWNHDHSSKVSPMNEDARNRKGSLRPLDGPKDVALDLTPDSVPTLATLDVFHLAPLHHQSKSEARSLDRPHFDNCCLTTCTTRSLGHLRPQSVVNVDIL